MWRVAMLSCLFFAIFVFGYLATRIAFVFSDIKKKRSTAKFSVKKRKGNVKTMVVVGSGGHTSEILRLLEFLGTSYSPKEYLIAATDKMSENKVVSFEEQKAGEGKPNEYIITKVPRSREVKQSYFTSVFSTLYASLVSFPIVFRKRPDLILCNGPGTCIPICLAGFLLTVIGVKRVTLVFVESVCRVQTLSLSGKILYYLADHHLVQWPALVDKYPSSRYIGRLS